MLVIVPAIVAARNLTTHVVDVRRTARPVGIVATSSSRPATAFLLVGLWWGLLRVASVSIAAVSTLARRLWLDIEG